MEVGEFCDVNFVCFVPYLDAPPECDSEYLSLPDQQ